MSEDKSKLQLIGEITEANNKNLELIEEINKLYEVLDKIKEYIAMVEHCALVDKKIIFSMRTLKDILEEIE